MINIDPNTYDEYYRYKRSVTSIEYIKNNTHVVNLKDLSKHLHVPEKVLMSMWKKKLNTSLNSSDVLKGSFSIKQLETYLNTFICEFILCKKCELPEIVHKKSKTKNTIKCTCYSCGEKYKIEVSSAIYNSFENKKKRNEEKKE